MASHQAAGDVWVAPDVNMLKYKVQFAQTSRIIPAMLALQTGRLCRLARTLQCSASAGLMQAKSSTVRLGIIALQSVLAVRT